MTGEPELEVRAGAPASTSPLRRRGVEVKSSAYLQSWTEQRHSSIVFTGLTGREWSADTNLMAEERSLRADVYVFALHTCREPDLYDPLDLNLWGFA